eukprot:1137740-Pelagomonas_calceolata.AAC.2
MAFLWVVCVQAMRLHVVPADQSCTVSCIPCTHGFVSAQQHLYGASLSAIMTVHSSHCQHVCTKSWNNRATTSRGAQPAYTAGNVPSCWKG